MCDSGNKSLAAARSILQYMQLLASTSYDISLFDQLPIVSINCFTSLEHQL